MEPKDPPKKRQSKTSTSASNAELMSFMIDMKADMKSDLDQINGKVQDIFCTVNDLKTENRKLKEQNDTLKHDVANLTSKLDRLEGHSRRNNLRFNGIPGSARESWNESEQKVRAFIKHDLNLPDLEHVEIERAHRSQGGKSSHTPSIIVKFTKFKDKSIVLDKAKQTLKNSPNTSVYEDYTDRVKLHRRELGKKLVEARGRGQYAAMSFDKLIIDTDVYRYDEDSQSMVRVGKARGRPGTRPDQPLDNDPPGGAEGGAQGTPDDLF